MQEWMGRVKREVGRVGFHYHGVYVRIGGSRWRGWRGVAYDSDGTVPGARAEGVFRY